MKSEIIGGWSSYKMYSDAVMSTSLESAGSIVDVWRHVGERPMRQFFHYEEPKLAYVNHISTPTEKLLTWQPMAITITFIALVVSIYVWVFL